MDTNKISSLADLLRKTGETILHGDKTLLLSDSLLKTINDSFTFLTEEDGDTLFQVTHTNNSEVELFRDIQFLHDFLQKVLKVRIIQDVYFNLQVPLSIQKLRNLRALELKQVSVRSIHGIQRLRVQLKAVKCICCIQQLQDILIMCGADRSSACLWEELIEGVFSHNGIDTVDRSFEYTPWLQKIDLSYNNFKSFSVSVSLPNLKHLNLSFNILESIPVLSRDASNKLEVLVLKNNYIKDLSGVLEFDNLLDLDVSCNSLHDHAALAPLHQLAFLRELNLVGNPLSFHKQHRIYTAQQLHLNAARHKVVLDGKELSGKERSHVSLRLPPTANSGAVSPRWYRHFHSEPAAAEVTLSHQGALVPKRTRQRKQVKEAIITEQAVHEEVDAVAEAAAEAKEIEAKEARAARLAEEARVQRLQLAWGGIRPSTATATSTTASSAVTTNVDTANDTTTVDTANGTTTVDTANGTTTAVHNTSTTAAVTTVTATTATGQLDLSQSQVFMPYVSLPYKEESIDELTPVEEGFLEKEVKSEVKVEGTKGAEALLDLLALEEGRVFAATRVREMGEEEIDGERLLCLEEEGEGRSLVERSAGSGCVRKQWTLPGALLACELLPFTHVRPGHDNVERGEERTCVRLTCDALRRDLQLNYFLMDAPDAQVFVRLIRDILDSRSLAEMNQVEYWCMKCSSQFSREENITFTKRDAATASCPSCGSRIVCTVDASDSSDTRAAVRSTAPVLANATLETESATSIASIPSVASAASIASATSATGGDSDVEVLSNPSHSRSRSRSNSQSSIEVLTHADSRGSRVESNSTLGNGLAGPARATAVPPALTESSSSGSLTDSVCTTYEHGTAADAPVLTPSAPTPTRSHAHAHAHAHASILTPAPLVAAASCDGGVDDDGSRPEESALFDLEHVPTLQEMYEGLLESVERRLAPGAGAAAGAAAAEAEVAPSGGAEGEDERVRFVWKDPRRVDHRVQLFAAQELFETLAERLLLAVRAEALRADYAAPFPAVLLVSSLHTWLFRVTGPEREWPGSWLREIARWDTRTLRWMEALPRGQGIVLSLSAPGATKGQSKGRERENSVVKGGETLVLLLQDPELTNILLTHAEVALAGALSEAGVPAVRRPSMVTLEKRVQALGACCGLPAGRGTPLAFLNVFNQFSIAQDLQSECNMSHGVVVVRERDVFVTETNFCWLLPNAPEELNVETVAVQEVCNLLEVEAWERKCIVVLHWEDGGKWQLSFTSSAVASAFMTALRAPWEVLFQVPLCIQQH